MATPETRVNPSMAADAAKPVAPVGAAKSKNPILRWLGTGTVKAPKTISLRKRTKFKSQDQHELGGVYASIATITYYPFGEGVLPLNITVRRESWLPSNPKWDGKDFDRIQKEDLAKPVADRQMKHDYRISIPGITAQRGDDEGAALKDDAAVQIFALYREARKAGKVVLETTSGRSALTLDEDEG